MKRIAVFNIEEIFEGKVTHHRLRVFKERGFKCINCNTIGSFVALDKDDLGAIHLDLYAKDKYGNDVLMTIDHIIPKSKGGNNHINNLNPMCCKCNAKKGSNYKETYKEGKI